MIQQRHFKITIENRDHFYRIVKFLNATCGPGKKNWTMTGRILQRVLHRAAEVDLHIFNSDVNAEDILFMVLTDAKPEHS